MRRLAERCGVRAPTLYHYFGDKQRLLDALLEERCRGLVAGLQRIRLGDDPVENVRAMCRVFARFGLRHPTHYALLAAPRAPSCARPPSAEKARALLEHPWDRLAAQGRLSADRTVARQAFWAFLHGFILLRTTRTDLEWAPELLEAGVDALLRSFVRQAVETSGVRR